MIAPMPALAPGGFAWLLRHEPGGFAWLLRHELRLALRGTGTRKSWFARNAPTLLLATVPTIGGVLLAWSIRDIGPVSDRDTTMIHNYLGIAVVGLLVLMLSTAAIAVLRTFHERHDLDLLLSAPLPPARVLGAKVVGVAVTVAAPFVLFAAPFLIASAVLGHPRWLGGLVMVAVDATLATAIALGLIGVLFSTIGPARARVIAQLGAALMGGTIFLFAQLRNVSPEWSHRLGVLVAARWSSPLDWPGRAALGDAVPLLAMVALALVAARGAAAFGARHLAASSDTATHRVRVRAGPIRFRHGLGRAVVSKELRLISRDPELITQIGLRLVYLIPLGALVLRGDHGIDAPGIAAAATACAGLLASSLSWIVVCAEDAPDLLAAAPVAAAVIERAKLAAACVVPLGVAVIAALALVGTAPGAAIVTLVMASIAALTAALIQAWFGRPQPRAAFRRRQSGSFVVGLGEIVLAGAWSGSAALAARGSLWAVAPAMLGAMIMAGAIEARRGRVN
jgi:ABC-2 type transport system permease protein